MHTNIGPYTHTYIGPYTHTYIGLGSGGSLPLIIQGVLLALCACFVVKEPSHTSHTSRKSASDLKDPDSVSLVTENQDNVA